MHNIQLQAKGLNVHMQTDDECISLDQTAKIARRELDHIFEERQDEDEQGMVTPPTSTVVIGEGDVIISAQGTDDETFREVHSAVVQEARYWMRESDMVIIDEADRIDQHIHHHRGDD